MTLEELVAEFRSRVFDTAAPYLWSEAEAISYANAAEREAATRAKLIEDATTAEVCQISGIAATATYALHSKILEVVDVTWEGKQLSPTYRAAMNHDFPDGWSTKTGTPTHFMDPQQRFLTLYPKPIANGDIALNVYRLPLHDLELADDEPEIHERYHLFLVDWMERLAYDKRDPDTYDAALAGQKEAIFAGHFGALPDANVQRKQNERRSRVVNMNPNW